MSPRIAVKGFTLLEILLVVLIISIMTAVGANLINSQSLERVILNQAQQFNQDLTFVCEKAVFNNQAYGIEFYSNSYQVLRYHQAEWVLVESQAAPRFYEELTTDLLLDGMAQELTAEQASGQQTLPHIICQTDGSFNAFELRFSATSTYVENNESDTIFYALETTSPWQLTGAWHEK